MHWYYAENGEQRGPFNDADFAKLVKDNVVKSSTPVWNPNMTDWKRCREVRDVIKRITLPEASDGDFVAYLDDAQSDRSQELKQDIPLAPVTDSDVPDERLLPKTYVDYMGRARQVLEGNWGVAVAFTLLYIVIMQSFQVFHELSTVFAEVLNTSQATAATRMANLIGFALSYFLTGVFQLGLCRFYLDAVRMQPLRVSRLFYGFSSFGRAVGAYMLMVLFILLWGLLFIIPGIMAAFSYSMTFFVLADNPELGAVEALKRSKQMMQGNRMKLFDLYCRFVGWYLLALLTCGIGVLWVQPYMMTSVAAFYDDLRGRANLL